MGFITAQDFIFSFFFVTFMTGKIMSHNFKTKHKIKRSILAKEGIKGK